MKYHVLTRPEWARTEWHCSGTACGRSVTQAVEKFFAGCSVSCAGGTHRFTVRDPADTDGNGLDVMLHPIATSARPEPRKGIKRGHFLNPIGRTP